MPDLTVRGPTGSPLVYRIDSDEVRIGRGADCDLVLADGQLSRTHAVLTRSGEGWRIADAGSRNGTFMNGRRLEAPEPVTPSDEIRIGRLTLTLGASEAARRAEPSETLGAEALARTLTAADPVLIGESAAMRAVREQVARYAPVDATVLITGESGTGKELVAQLLHRRSTRAGGPFVVVNCPAIPASLLDSELFGVERGVATGVEARQGRLETADRGTVFLDEIGDLDPAGQAKLLRFLQDHRIDRVGGRQPVHVDARVVAATNRDLEADVAAGRFRLDLYHRLAAFRIRLPPLRERREDVALLVEDVLGRGDHPRPRMSPETLAILASGRLDGNVRALIHAVQAARAMARGDVILPEDLPETYRDAAAPTSGSEAEALDARLTAGESFWTIVHRPYLDRQLSRDVVQRLLVIGRSRARSYKALARVYGIEGEYKRFVNFIVHHGLGSED